MKKIILLVCLSLPVLASQMAIGAHHEELGKTVVNRDVDEAAVQKVYKVWNTAVEAGDRKGYLSILDNEIRMVAPGAPDIQGIEAYAEFLIPVFANAQYKITHLSDHEVEFLSPDVAVVRYDYIVDVTMGADVDVITDSDAALDQLSNNLKYQDLLRRQTDGSWKVLRHMWNDGYAR